MLASFDPPNSPRPETGVFRKKSRGFRRAWHWENVEFRARRGRTNKTKTKVSTCQWRRNRSFRSAETSKRHSICLETETEFSLASGYINRRKQFLRLGRKKEKTTEWHRSLTLAYALGCIPAEGVTIDWFGRSCSRPKWPADRSLSWHWSHFSAQETFLCDESEKRPV